jgi:peptidoglycan hydrolase-like protein with peptidoglycan-binding domain
MLHPLRTLHARTIVWLAVLVAIAALPGTAIAQDTPSAPGLSPRLLADASWHGRPIQRPLAHRTTVTDRPPSLRPGTGYHRPGGSRRVRDLQRRLIRLGYRPGTRDGLFGPRTQAAVLAFQHKHGLPRTGSAGPDTLRVLRHRTTPGATASQPATEPPVQPQSQTPRRATPPAPPVTPAADSDGLPLLAVILILGLALPLLMLTGLLARRRRTPAVVVPEPGEPRWLRPAPPPAPPPFQPTVAEPVAPPPQPQEAPRIRRTAPPPHGPPQQRRAALRERILAMRADGMSLQEIADQLTSEGIPTLGGARHWQPWSVRAATRPTNPTGTTPTHGRRQTP